MYSADSLGPLASLMPDELQDEDEFPILPEPPSVEQTVANREIAFVVSDIQDSDQILASLERGGIEVFWISDTDDGVDVISDTLAQKSNIDTVHIVSHGQSSSLLLGTASIDSDSISTVEVSLQSWAHALGPDADLLIYGCDFASDSNGVAMLSRLAELTGADVAASDDLTGHESLGGDWELEVAAGQIESDTFDDEVLQDEWQQVLPETIVVTNMGDAAAPDMSATVATLGSDPTLREAVFAAMNTGGDVTIELATAGEYTLSRAGSDDTGEGGDIDITMQSALDQLTITNTSGGEVSITQNYDSRVFELREGRLNLEYVNIVNASYDRDGAGIFVHADTSLFGDNVRFVNLDSVDSLGGAIYSEGTVNLVESFLTDNHGESGGAIFSTISSDLILSHVEATGNRSDINGAVIAAEGTLSITNGDFRDNISDNAGGVIISNSDVTIESAGFSNNSSESSGGAITQIGGSLNISNTSFIGNSAHAAYGGALEIVNDTELTINNVAFQSNSATGNDGTDGRSTGLGGGGALYLNAPDATISNTSFSDNEAFLGGAVLVGLSGDDAQFDTISFTQNKSERDHQPVAIGGGGAVMTAADRTNFVNTLFDKNEAIRGGALAIAPTSSGTDLLNTTFSENTASQRGGAIYALNMFFVDHSTFYRNAADNPNQGGAINTNSPFGVRSSVFYENTANGLLDDVKASQAVNSFGFNVFTSIDAGDINESLSDRINLSVAERALLGLGALTPNPGLVATHPLLPTSSLINAGAMDEAGIADSRGVIRDTLPDIGSHEAEASQAIFYMLDDQNRVLRGDYGSGVTQVIVDGRPADGSSEPRDIVVDMSGEKLYWIEVSGGSSSIMTSDLDGDNIHVFANIVGDTARTLALDTTLNRLYVAYSGGLKNIDWYDTDGGLLGSPTQFGSQQTSDVRDMEVDSLTGRLFWTEWVGGGTSQLSTLNADGTFDTMIAYTGELNGLAVNEGAQTVAALDTAAGQIQTYDYTLTTPLANDVSEGESLDYDSSSDNFVTASILSQGLRVYDSTPSQIQAVAIASGRPEAVAVATPIVIPEVELAENLFVGENNTVEIDSTKLLVTNTRSGEGAENIVFTIQYTPVDPLGSSAETAGIYRLDTILTEYIKLDINDTFTQLDVNQGLIQYRQNGQENNPDAASDRVDLNVHGIQSALPDVVTLEVDVAAANDTPVVVETNTWTVGENAVLSIDNSLLLVTDDDLAHSAAQLVYALDALPPSPVAEADLNKLAGIYLDDGTGTFSRLAIGGTFTQQDMADGYVEYRQNGQDRNLLATDDQVRLTARDPDGASTGTITIDVVVDPVVNDIPVVVEANPWTVGENSALGLNETLLLVTDTDLADTKANLVYTLDILPPSPVAETDPARLAGIYLNDGTGTFTRLALGDTFTQQDIANGYVEYRQNGQEKNLLATDDQVQLTARDSASASTGAITIDVVVSPELNDTPVVVEANPWAVGENAALGIDETLLLVTDDDLIHTRDQIIYTLNGLPPSPVAELDPNKLAGLYLNDGTGTFNRLAIGDTFTQQDIANGYVEYRQNGQQGNLLAADDQVQIIARDPAFAESGTFSVDVIVSDVPNVPVIVNAEDWNVSENGVRAIDQNLLSVTDSDLADDASAIVYTVDAVPLSPTGATLEAETAGLYKLDIGSGLHVRVNVNDTFSQQDVIDGHIEYRQNGQERNLAPSDDRILLSVRDTAGNSPGAIAVNVVVTDAEDLPRVQHSGPWTINENGELAITGTPAPALHNGVLLTVDNDLDDTPDSVQYTVVTLPTTLVPFMGEDQAAGLFRFDSTSVAADPYVALLAGDVFTQQDVNNGLVVYRQNGQERLSATIPDRLELTVVDADGNASIAPLAIDIVVTPENDVPELSFSPASVSEGGFLVLDLSILNIADADEASIDSLTIEFISPLHGTIEVDGGDNRAVTGAEMIAGLVRYTHNDLETENGSVLVRVTDSSSDSVESTLSIDVTAINDLPVVTTTPVTVLESGAIEILPANLLSQDEETDNNLLHYHIDASSLSYGRIEDTTGTSRTDFSQQEIVDSQILYIHDGSEPAPEVLLFEVHDADGGITAASLDILVEPSPDAPILAASMDRQFALEGQMFTLPIDTALWTDSDAGDSLTLEVTLLGGQAIPSWLIFEPSTGVLSGTPENSDVGTVTLRVMAIDQAGLQSAPLIFDLEVRNSNTAPVDVSLVGRDVDENSVEIIVGVVSARDLDIGDVLSYSVSDDRFEIVSGELLLRPGITLDHEAEAEIDMLISATDALGAVSSLPVTIAVNDLNDLPVLLTTPTIPVLQPNIPVQIPVDTFTDEDQLDTITYTALLADRSALPEWLEFTAAREFIVTIDTPPETRLDLILIADDSNGGRSELPLSLTFEPTLAPAEPIAETLELEAILPPVITVTEQEPEPETASAQPESESEAAVVAPELDSDEERGLEILEVDLQALIAPLPSSDGFELAEVAESEFRVLPSSFTRTDTQDSINLGDLTSLLEQSQQIGNREYANLVDALDKQRDEVAEDLGFRQKLVGSTVGLTSGFSVGYVIWLIRGGTLMGSMLSALPAWRFVDPLPILGALDDGDVGDDDSLESLVDSVDSSDVESDDPNSSDPDQASDQPKAA